MTLPVLKYKTPALARTCRQIRAEVLPLFNKAGSFNAKSIREVQDWQRTSGVTKASEIRHLRIEFRAPPHLIGGQMRWYHFTLINLFSGDEGNNALQIILPRPIPRSHPTIRKFRRLLASLQDRKEYSIDDVLVVALWVRDRVHAHETFEAHPFVWNQDKFEREHANCFILRLNGVLEISVWPW